MSAPWPPWFGPEPAVDPDASTVLVTVGGEHPVVRIPEELALPALERLRSHAPDRALLGLVLHHPQSGVTYWWVRPGASPDYPEGCRLLADRTAIPVPAPGGRPCIVAEWLHLPDREQLTGPAWLARALRDQEAAVEAEALTATVAALLDTLTWTPGRCDYCPDGPEVMVTVAEGDMESGAGYHGTFCRSHLRLALAMNGHQANGAARTAALNMHLDAGRRKRAEAAQ